MLCWSGLTSRRVILAEDRDLTATGPAGRARRPIGEIMRKWGYTVAGEADGIDTNGVVFTRVDGPTRNLIPEACNLLFDRL